MCLKGYKGFLFGHCQPVCLSVIYMLLIQEGKVIKSSVCEKYSLW